MDNKLFCGVCEEQIEYDAEENKWLAGGTTDRQEYAFMQRAMCAPTWVGEGSSGSGKWHQPA